MIKCHICGGNHDSSRSPDPRCRRIQAFYDVGNARFHLARYQSSLYPLYIIADFLRRMASPKHPREVEFAKRFAHRRGVA